jgi:hypothetical protein
MRSSSVRVPSMKSSTANAAFTTPIKPPVSSGLAGRIRICCLALDEVFIANSL